MHFLYSNSTIYLFCYCMSFLNKMFIFIKNYFSWMKISEISSLIWLKLAISYIAISSIIANVLYGVSKICFVEGCLNLSLPFNWKILFLGSIFYAIGFIIYNYKCPKFIKNYPSYYYFSKSSYIPSDVLAELCEAKEYIEGSKENGENKDYLNQNLQDIKKAIENYEKKKDKIILHSYSGEECPDLMTNELLDGSHNYRACYNMIIDSFGEKNNIYKKLIAFFYIIFFISVLYSIIWNIFNVLLIF